MRIKKVFKQTEFYIFIAILLMAFFIQIRSSQFFTNNNLVDLVRSLIVPAMFCIAEMMVLISGGIDVSFPAIASLSMFVVSTQLLDSQIGVWAMLLIGSLIGVAMGAVNGFLIGYFQFPSLIVTLGTASLFTGILHGALKAMEKPVPQAMYDLGKAHFFTVKNEASGLSSNMPTTVIFLIVLVILVWFIMNKTIFGRGIYAIGGDKAAAKRVGFNVFGTLMFVYCFAGLIAGFTGIVRASMILDCHPNNLEGMEMIVIAACVLGGVNILGGRGTITGTILGIALLTIISNSLILIGVPVYWQRVFMGLAIIIGTGVSAYQILRNRNKLAKKLQKKEAGP